MWSIVWTRVGVVYCWDKCGLLFRHPKPNVVYYLDARWTITQKKTPNPSLNPQPQTLNYDPLSPNLSQALLQRHGDLA